MQIRISHASIRRRRRQKRFDDLAGETRLWAALCLGATVPCFLIVLLVGVLGPSSATKHLLWQVPLTALLLGAVAFGVQAMRLLVLEPLHPSEPWQRLGRVLAAILPVGVAILMTASRFVQAMQGSGLAARVAVSVLLAVLPAAAAVWAGIRLPPQLARSSTPALRIPSRPRRSPAPGARHRPPTANRRTRAGSISVQTDKPVCKACCQQFREGEALVRCAHNPPHFVHERCAGDVAKRRCPTCGRCLLFPRKKEVWHEYHN